MKVLVTGSTGFLGRHVVAALLRRGHSVRAMVRPATNVEAIDWANRGEFFRGDLRNCPNLLPAFDGIDVLVHLAAAVQGDFEAQFAGTVTTTERLLDAMSRSHTRRLILASSFAIYDWEHAHGTLTADSPLEEDVWTRDPYTAAKLWQERITRRYAASHQWDLTVLRPGLLWGKDHPYLARVGQSVGPLHLVIAPRNHPPLCYVENCADCFAAAVDCPGAVGRTLNVTDDSPTSWQLMRDYLDNTGTPGVRVPIPFPLARVTVRLAWWTARRMFGPDAKLPGLFVPRRFEPRFKPIRYDRDTLATVLHWRPPVSFSDALARTKTEDGEWRMEDRRSSSAIRRPPSSILHPQPSVPAPGSSTS